MSSTDKSASDNSVSTKAPTTAVSPLVDVLKNNRRLQLLLASDSQLAQQVVADPVRTIFGNPALRDAVLGDKDAMIALGGNLQNSVQDAISDPEVQKQAKELASRGINLAGRNFTHAAQEVLKCVEEGPRGVQKLCCYTSIAGLIISIWSMLNIFSFIFAPVSFILNLYIVAGCAALFSLEGTEEEVSFLPQQFESIISHNMEKCRIILLGEIPALKSARIRGFFVLFLSLMMIHTSTSILAVPIGMVMLLASGILLGVPAKTFMDQLEKTKLIDMTTRGSRNWGSIVGSGLGIEDRPSTNSSFEKAVAVWKKSNKSNVPLLIALYRQATDGDCKETSCSGGFMSCDKAVFDAHNGMVGMTSNQAKDLFLNACVSQGVIKDIGGNSAAESSGSTKKSGDKKKA